jgi:hypothetical protein
MTRLETAQFAYVRAFGVEPPEPWGVDDERIAEVLERAIVDRKPVSASFDWWAHVPPDGVA